MKKNYCAFFHVEGKGINVTFPDFPGCVTNAKTYSEAISKAKEVLEFHIEGMLENNEILPEPGEIDFVYTAAKECDEYPLIAIIETELPERSTQRINITMQGYVLDRLDKYIQQHKSFKNRSNFLSEVALKYIADDIKMKKTHSIAQKKSSLHRKVLV